MKTMFEESFTEEMKQSPAQIRVTGKCVEPVLEALDALTLEGEAEIVEQGDRLTIAVPALSLPELLKEVVKPLEVAITNIPEDAGGFSVSRRIPAADFENQEPELVEINGFGYWGVKVVLGVGFGHQFGVVQVCLPSERRQEARNFLYRVQLFANRLDGAKTKGSAQVFGGQEQAVRFVYGCSDGDLSTAARNAKKFLYAAVGRIKDRLYTTNGGDRNANSPRRQIYSDQSPVRLGDVIDVAALSFVVD